MIRTQIFQTETSDLLQRLINEFLRDYKISSHDLIDIKYYVASKVTAAAPGWQGEAKLFFTAMIIHNVKVAKFKFDEQPEEKREYKINNNH